MLVIPMISPSGAGAGTSAARHTIQLTSPITNACASASSRYVRPLRSAAMPMSWTRVRRSSSEICANAP